MSWLALVVIAVGLYVAFRAVGFVVRLLVWGAILLAGGWLLAPHLGLALPG